MQVLFALEYFRACSGALLWEPEGLCLECFPRHPSVLCGAAWEAAAHSCPGGFQVKMGVNSIKFQRVAFFSTDRLSIEQAFLTLRMRCSGVSNTQNCHQYHKRKVKVHGIHWLVI